MAEVLEIEVRAKGAKSTADEMKSLAEAVDMLSKATKKTNIANLSSQISSLNNVLSGITNDTVNRISKLANALAKISSSGGISKVKALSNANVPSASNSNKTRPPIDWGGESTPYQRTAEPLTQSYSDMAIAAQRANSEIEALTRNVGVSQSIKPDYEFANQQIELANACDLVEMKLDSAREKLAMMASDGKSNAEQIANQIEKCQRLSAELERLRNTSERTSVGLGKTGKSIKKLFSAIGRIAFYRAIRTAIKSVTDAFSTGLTNAYNFSKGVGGSLASTLDTISTKSLTMKNQLGSAFGALLQAVAPIILTLINLITKLANALSMIYGAFTGGTYLKAKDTFKSWADDAKTGAGATKEWKNQLMGFDEINKLEDQSGSGGGSGSALDVNSMFDEVAIPEKIKSAVDWIKNHLELILGIATAIGGAIIGWKLLKTVSDLQKFTGALKTSLGIIMAVAGAALLVYEYIKAWANGIDWGNFAGMLTGIALLVGGLALAFGKIGAAIGMLVSGIALIVLGFKEWINTGKLSIEAFTTIATGILLVGAAISLLIGGWIPLLIAGVTVAVVGIVALITNNWNAIKEWTISTWESIKTTIVNKFEEIKSKVTTLASTLLTKITTLWSNIKSKVSSGISTVKSTIQGFISWIPTAVSNICSQILTSIRNTVSNIISSVSSAIDRVKSLISLGNSASSSSSSSSSGSGVKKFASGGTPATGSLFIAGESGAELVSSVGGRTNVSNTDQIANSVSVGNEGVVSAVYAMANAIIKTIDSKDMDVSLDGMSLARKMYKYNSKVTNEHGMSLINA